MFSSADFRQPAALIGQLLRSSAVREEGLRGGALLEGSARLGSSGGSNEQGERALAGAARGGPRLLSGLWRPRRQRRSVLH
ncbi:unnamed protein product [Rangifer tarandus platyrhynchus]|uniref:Uncharacterized protein n=1 Tax=Rangifer tarandus platyrhynchus TaxID=3082113 RepID=A0AC59YRF6_RANTA